ncbi:GH25 family lysozyme [Lactobacillaceae bacterium 24-114]
MPIYAVDVFSGSDDSIIRDPHAQAVITKATQGTGYVNPRCNHQWELAGELNKLRGLYHYAGGGNPEMEAQYFINNIKNYVGQGMLVVDWESYQNAAWGDPTWVRRFVDEVHRLTGVWCVIYVQESALWQVANCANTCGVWVAKYLSMDWRTWMLPDMSVSSGAFAFLTGWQFTGGDMDRDIFFLDEEGWKKLGQPDNGEQPQQEEQSQTTISIPETPQPRSWSDSLGDTWYEEHGTFTTNQPINLRWGAKTSSSLIATLPAGTDVDYDAYSRHDGYVWLRQPRSDGQYGYLVCRDANTNEAFGTFK